jgi:hypothetical protein
MLTAEHKRSILSMPHGPRRALWVVLKCGLCLAALMLLVEVGNAFEQDRVPQVAHKVGSYSASRVETHRKEVFDGRRAVFMRHSSNRDTAGSAPATHSDMVTP